MKTFALAALLCLATAPLYAQGPPGAAQCADGIDNDGDGHIDFGQDPDCDSFDDNTEAFAPSPAVLFNPNPPTLTEGTQAFEWIPAQGAVSYFLTVATYPGAVSIFSQNVGNVTSYTVTGMPTNGIQTKVTLWTLFPSPTGYLKREYIFTSVNNGPGLAELQTPTDPVLPGANVTFTWSAGTNVSEYWFDLGLSSGGCFLKNQGTGPVRSITVLGLPTNGGALYVRVWSRIFGTWGHRDYTFFAAPSTP